MPTPRSMRDLSPLATAWIAVGAFFFLTPPALATGSLPIVLLLLAAVVVVIVISSFGVVRQAERLAAILGDPWGTLILTLTVVSIEVILISAVMLGPGEHPTIARDSITAVMMIILNLVTGLALILGGLRHGPLPYRRTGTNLYVGMTALLLAFAYGLPLVTGDGTGSLPPHVALTTALLTFVLYAIFLWQQIGPLAPLFSEVDEQNPDSEPPLRLARARAASTRPTLSTNLRREVWQRSALLLVTIVPIVLLSQQMAAAIDLVLVTTGLPVTLGGFLIAVIVFTPETLTTLRAAWGKETQRTINLLLGAFVSTAAVSIPSALLIGLLAGVPVVFGESPVNLFLIAATMLLTAITFSSRRLTAIHGAIHLILFVLFLASFAL